MNDIAIEQEIQAKGLTAPRVTPADLQANIVAEYYFTAQEGVSPAGKVNEKLFEICQQIEKCGASTELTKAITMVSDLRRELSISQPDSALSLLTYCVLVLSSGFTVTGESACASPEDFDAELGRKIARQNAVAKVWTLMGYHLKCQLAEDQK